MVQQNTQSQAYGAGTAGVQLVLLENGRYGYYGQNGRNMEFTCGHPVDVLVRDGDTLRWMPTRFEHNGRDYYLVGYQGVPLCGLTVRERGDQE